MSWWLKNHQTVTNMWISFRNDGRVCLPLQAKKRCEFNHLQWCKSPMLMVKNLKFLVHVSRGDVNSPAASTWLWYWFYWFVHSYSHTKIGSLILMDFDTSPRENLGATRGKGLGEILGNINSLGEMGMIDTFSHHAVGLHRQSSYLNPPCTPISSFDQDCGSYGRSNGWYEIAKNRMKSITNQSHEK